MAAKQEVDVLLYKLSKAGDSNIPTLLLQIEQLLEQHDNREIRSLLWENEIMSTMTDVIKQDFEGLRVPWSTATKLCTLLAKCCMGFTQSQEFSGVFLPLVVDSFMELANNIQGLVSPDEEDFRQCLECVFWLVDYSPSLGQTIIESPRLLTMLMTESSVGIDMCLLKLLRVVLTQSTAARYYIERDKLLVIFDEVMLKMTEQDIPALQQIGADVIYQAAKRHQPFRSILLENGEEVVDLLEVINTAPGAHDNINMLLK
ncbi:IQ calmodulin-binding motif-containing protein 1-like [Bolinopsis microptera]|uniref:IQ calmodulin-binding motif-containing protein 1-like n=1 Tax=Bolinopsis microptera TaxID=2820187 RepID=UPI003078B5CB